MKGFQRSLSVVLIFIMVSGCAASRTAIISDSGDLSDTQICRNYLNDYADLQAKGTLSQEERDYLQALTSLVLERGLTNSQCEELVSESNATVAAVGLLVLIAAALAESGGGGGAPDYSSYSNSGYAWDQFYDQYYNLVWRCRDKSNGQFAYDYQCASAIKADTTWPSK